MMKWKKSPGMSLMAIILSITTIAMCQGIAVSAEESGELESSMNEVNNTVSGSDAGLQAQSPMIVDEDSLEDVLIPSAFLADEELIGQGLQIKIPADFNPIYYKEDGEFRCDSHITVTGELAEHRRLKMETPPQILYYAEQNDEISVPGTVKFGKDGVEYWYTEEILDAGGELAKPISIVIDRRDIIVPANYKTSIVFSFALEEVQDEPSEVSNSQDSIKPEMEGVGPEDTADF